MAWRLLEGRGNGGKGVGILSCYLWDVIACCMSLVVAEAEVVRVHL